MNKFLAYLGWSVLGFVMFLITVTVLVWLLDITRPEAYLYASASWAVSALAAHKSGFGRPD